MNFWWLALWNWLGTIRRWQKALVINGLGEDCHSHARAVRRHRLYGVRGRPVACRAADCLRFLARCIVQVGREPRWKLSKAEIKDAEVLDRFFRMDFESGRRARPAGNGERQAAVFRRAQNSLMAIKPSGSGELPESAVVWKHMRGAPYVTTPVLDRGILYMVKEGGIVSKLEIATGRLLQEERVPGVEIISPRRWRRRQDLFFANEAGMVSVLGRASRNGR